MKTKRLFQTLVVALALGVASAHAGPVSYDGSTSTTDGSSYDSTPMLLGTQLSFDAWWEVLNPVADGNPLPALNLNVNVAGLPFITSVYRNSSTASWLNYVANLDPSLLGQTQSIHIAVDDFGEGTGTTVWIDNLQSLGDSAATSSTVDIQAVPEPGSLLLLGAGLAALGLRARRRPG